MTLMRVKCRVYLDPEDIFKCEVEETHAKLLTALVGLDSFKQAYEHYRCRLSEYRTNSSSDASLEDWQFPPKIIFHRYDRFLARLANIRVCITSHSIFSRKGFGPTVLLLQNVHVCMPYAAPRLHDMTIPAINFWPSTSY